MGSHRKPTVKLPQSTVRPTVNPIVNPLLNTTRETMIRENNGWKGSQRNSEKERKEKEKNILTH
ncbi:hypothetical protein glysoja_038707 [Glycine soja]|uniref:Uncharacterized protein n=1 Tax=Glycine soja TaxID=3848 RepID=A0A0B2PDU1_GLYSO|nr:hypothetical protein JHK87_010614 [Glycine soja]KAG5067013.1 hypothetical protein JHK86_010744 [Glycine max]KHN05793.1 hypothetical protein glysoja_038707 [Glycine soja]